jgi:hypothetical protein
MFLKKDKPATVVMAYYDFPKSKYTTEDYRSWIRLFLTSVPCWLVFFCEAEFAPFVEECRKAWSDRTRVIHLHRSQWIAHQRFGDEFWVKQHKMDPEKDRHSPDLYKVWWEKKEFVKRAMALNPFGHDDFVYTDAGICRYPGLAKLLRSYPVADRIPSDRILLMNVSPFTRRDDFLDPKGSSGTARIGGGILAGSRKTWEQYDRLYEKVFDLYITRGLFVGKDQTLMATLVLENRGFVSLLDARPIFWIPWFYLLAWLGVPETLWRKFQDPRESGIRRTLEDLLRLANLE